jgi:hypothetical protein
MDEMNKELTGNSKGNKDKYNKSEPKLGGDE